MANASYSLIFDATTSWDTASDGYAIVIPAATHGMGLFPCVAVWAASDTEGEYLLTEGYPTTGYRVGVTTSGTVTLSASERFAGKIVIADGLASSSGGSASVTIAQLAMPSTQNAIQSKVNEIIAGMSSSGGNSGPYADQWEMDAWVSTADGYAITFPATKHGLGTDISVEVWKLENGSWFKTHGYPTLGYIITESANGDITLSVTEGGTFEGRIIIR